MVGDERGAGVGRVGDTKSTAQYFGDDIYNKLQRAPQHSWFSPARSIDSQTPPIKPRPSPVTATLRKHQVPAERCFECGDEITAFSGLCD